MNILLVAATEAEIALSTEYMDANGKRISDRAFELHGHTVTLCITGVGMTATAYAVTRALLTGKYDLALQAGVGGSFDRAIPLGSVVFITTDRFGDLGAEDKGNYIDIFDLGLTDQDKFPFSGGILATPSHPVHEKITLPRVSALTVNTVTGYAPTIDRLRALYGCQTESMEGAAFHYVCLCEGVPFVQLRAISNYVEPRNRENWQMKKAIVALNDYLTQLLKNL